MLKRLTEVEEFVPFLQNNLDKLVIVKFSTSWCPPCQALQKNIEKLLITRQDLAVLEVDAEKFPELAQKPEFSIRAVPTIFLFQQGKMIKKNSGYLSSQQLEEFINT